MLFLGYLDKWPRKWPGIGRALANPVPISQSGANRSIWCQSANPVPIRCQSVASCQSGAIPDKSRAANLNF